MEEFSQMAQEKELEIEKIEEEKQTEVTNDVKQPA